MRVETPVETRRIRKASLDDLRTVQAINRTSFASPWTDKMIEEELVRSWCRILLAEEAVKSQWLAKGFSLFWMVSEEQHLLNIATDLGYRRQGVGRRLLQATLEEGRKNGCAQTFLEVRVGNTAAIGLYQALGFRRVATRLKYYADNQEDAWVMMCDLRASVHT
jgi:ribosomal-protein-alanine N-acetyltransferase